MIYITWFALCILIAVIASNKGRSAIGFFFLSLILSPLVGFIAVALARPNTNVIEEKQLASGETKKCPYCAELIKSGAVICRYCQKDLPAPQFKNRAQSMPGLFSLSKEEELNFSKVLEDHGLELKKDSYKWVATEINGTLKRFFNSDEKLKIFVDRFGTDA